ncbi:unnamed protein product [Sphagnum jensenii]|uniref:histidine kinase n=1 Tax=Sphagnum jensenii TaxID=128206 RepID=A0ABP1AC66_9BRYO
MRVRQGSGRGGGATPWSLPSQHAVYKIDEGGEPFVTAGGGTGFETGNSTSTVRENGGGFRLIRHNSAVYEHDIRSSSSTSSLVRTVSQLREEFHLGLPWKNGSQGSGFPGNNSESSKKQVISGGGAAAGSDQGSLLQLSSSSEFSHQAKGGQLDSFVYKNYSLQDRRTLSLPVGTQYLINEFVGHSHELNKGGQTKGGSPLPPRQQSVTPPAATTRSSSISFIRSSSTTATTRLTESLTVATADDNDDAAATNVDVEVDRKSKIALFLQAARALLTMVAAVVVVFVYLRFLTSRSSGDGIEYEQEVPLESSSSSMALADDAEAPVSFFFYCKMFIRACPFLGFLSALLTIISGSWGTSCDSFLWSRSHDEADGNCSHCVEIEDSRMRIEQADEKVQRAQQAKQQFMAYVFHNIRVPFNAIVLGLGHMQASGDVTDPIGNGTDKMDLVQMMLDCAETMTSVLDDVTDMGQWEVGQMELHSDELDILAVIKFLAWGLKDLLQQKEIAFNMDVDEFVNKLLTSHFVLGDKQRIVQTLGNFLSNAVKFTPAGGKLELKVQCEGVVENKHVGPPLLSEKSCSSMNPVAQTGDTLLGVTGSSILTKTSSQTKNTVDKVATLRISVRDNGIGISAEDQAKLFEPYSFVTSGWVQKGGVSGLGLSMAKRYVERVGGSIGVKSSIGEGSTFFFSIPFPLVPRNSNNKAEVSPSNSDTHRNSEAPESSRKYNLSTAQKSISKRRKSMEQEVKSVQKEPDTKPAGNMQKDSGPRQRKVLLVEDTRINRIILRKVLQNLNLLCDEAENGQVAVDFHKQGKTYDLVLMDKEMPVMDGHQATRQLRMMGVKTPIIALTGNAMQSDRELFFEAGVNDFQTKPLSRDKLVQLLIRHGVESSIPVAS